jgi:hypothetical protein
MRKMFATSLVAASIVLGCGSAAPTTPASPQTAPPESSLSVTAAPPASPLSAPPESSLSVTAKEYEFEAPASIGAGPTLISLTNSGTEVHHAQLWQLKDGTTFEAYQAILQKQSHEATVGAIASFAGGVGSLAPGQTAQAIVDVKPGTYAFVCRVQSPSLHLYRGMVRKLVVTEAGSVSSDWVPEPDGTVTFADNGFTLPSPVTAGHHVWIFKNEGPGPRAFEVKSGSDYFGGSELIDAGSSQTVILDLVAGDYRATSTWVAPDPTWTDFTVK